MAKKINVHKLQWFGGRHNVFDFERSYNQFFFDMFHKEGMIYNSDEVRL